MSFRSFRLQVPVIFLALTGFFLLFFGKIFIYPNDFLITGDFDGLKNYYTPAYYVQYDSGFHFSGMNYPYGTHVVYADNQPVLSILIKWLGLQSYTIGIMNVLMFASYYLCAFFLYRILTETKVEKWFAVSCSIIITILSPQLFRITGHFALAYAAFIPMLWYVLIRYYQRRHFAYLLFIFLGVLLSGFTHPYYLLIGLLLCLSFSAVALLQKRADYRFPATVLLAAALPIVVFRLVMLLTDPVKDRVDNVFGPLNYRAMFESVFLPVTGPFLDAWNFFIPLKPAKFEGYSYVGFAGLLVLIFSLIKIYRYIKRKKYRMVLKPVLPEFLSISIWAGFLVLFFAMAYPLKWNLEFLLDYIKSLKQFRSIGRFAWIFYYIFTVYTAWYIYMLFRYFNRRNRQIAVIVTGLFLLSWLADGIVQMHAVSKTAYEYFTENFFKSPVRREARYQALLALPFYIAGTEKIDMDGSGHIRKLSMKESFRSGIPLVNPMLSRLSRSEIVKVMQIFNDPLLPQGAVNDWDPAKPVLVMVDKNAGLRESEKEIVKRSHFLREDPQTAFYELWPDSLKRKLPGMRLSKLADNGIYVYRHFDEVPGQKPFLGKGMFGGRNGKNGLIFFEGNLPGAAADSIYELSVWVYLDHEWPGMPPVLLEKLDDTGAILEKAELRYSNLEFDVVEDWIRLEYSFIWKREYAGIRLAAGSPDMILDELLIRPENKTVVFEGTEGKSINNYPVNRKERK